MSQNKAVVLQLIKGLDIGGVNGGAERFSVDLSFNLHKLGYKIIVCAFFQMHSEAEKDWLSRIQNQSIQVFHAAEWKGNNNFNSYLQGFRTLTDFLDHNPVNIIHSHFQLGTIAAIYLKNKQHYPHVLRTAHNVNEWDQEFYGWIRKQLFSKWIYPIMLDAQVGVSQAIVDQLSQHPGVRLNRNKPQVIYNGINFPSLPEKIVSGSGKENSIVVGSVGRLSEQKGYIYLIRAIPKVLSEFPNVKFQILGDGPLSASLLKEAESLNISDQLILEGQVPDVYRYLVNYDLFVSCSLWEGLPTALLEAIWAEVPVVASNISGNNEIIQAGQNGWLVRSADSDALANEILTALKMPDLRKQYALEAKKKIHKFSIDGISLQYDYLYQKILRENGRDR